MEGWLCGREDICRGLRDEILFHVGCSCLHKMRSPVSFAEICIMVVENGN